uniref:Caspase-1 n=1 Tax=Salvator merianae TaxID=96440 RepID=A0A8D0BP13_SALMN
MADIKLKEIRIQFINGVNETNIKQLLDKLLARHVMNEEELDEVKAERKKQDQARTLIDHVIKKGPKASQILIECLHCCSAILAENLGLQVPPAGPENEASSSHQGPKPMVSASAAQPSECKNGITLCPPNRLQEIQRKEGGEIYPIKDPNARSRLALIICNIEFESLLRREGAEVDLKEMTLLLEGLGYKVETETNLSSEDMTQCLKNFAAREEHKNSDSTFVVLMSHGIQAGLCGVKCRDGSSDILTMDTVVATFNNWNCQGLRGKPKVIIIQACRGENKGYFFASDSVSPIPGQQSPEALVEDALKKLPKESDFLCLYSTTPDNVSWRSPEKGSLFIIKLIENIKQHAWNCNLEEIFRKVLQYFENNPDQMPSKDRTTLTKKFYLFPGH